MVSVLLTSSGRWYAEHQPVCKICIGSSCGTVQAGGLPEGYDINYVLFGLTGEEAKEKMLYGKVWDE